MIKVEELSKYYHVGKEKRLILDKVNLAIAPGDKVGLLGRNGAGKSTFVKLLGGAELPTGGTIKRGMTVSWPLGFGGAFQGSLSGHDNLRFICRVYDIDYHETLDYVQDFAQLGRQFYDPVKTYSSGMQARLGFALSLAIEFDCYLTDEVFMVGDARFGERCREELFGKRANRTLVIVSHDMDFMRKYCTRGVIVHDRKLHEYPTVDAAIDRYYQL
ncbi:ABC transporter ATP-binding protein [Formicincola oecophyllae]|uniref:ABC transporter ATP-binding protein n=1 Tax=Formicincola oecophyllae TaxID=2558361 RepID=A0A4Y6UA22_9PROT|nr:ABC transporter ATP-binding protein [Formicincola oecophyllae]